MSSFAKQIIAQGFCSDANGEQTRLHSHTSSEQGEYIVGLLREIDANHTLEVGVAYGISSLFVCDYLKAKNGHHIMIDPYQYDRHWKGLGIYNLKQAGLEPFTTFIKEDARTVLPRLADEGKTLDFAYIDASKRLDDTLIFFFYIFRMLRTGGIIAFDDVAYYPGISMALRFILEMPGVEMHSTHGAMDVSAKRNAITKLAQLCPKSRNIFRDEWSAPLHTIGLNAGCVAIQKRSDDIGDWDFDPL